MRVVCLSKMSAWNKQTERSLAIVGAATTLAEGTAGTEEARGNRGSAVYDAIHDVAGDGGAHEDGFPRPWRDPVRRAGLRSATVYGTIGAGGYDGAGAGAAGEALSRRRSGVRSGGGGSGTEQNLCIPFMKTTRCTILCIPRQLLIG